MRIGLGCMRLTAVETIAAAVDAGVTIYDTARAYDGNEALLARALRGVDDARIVTKGGMGAGWAPDGRAKTIRADCEASLAALDGLSIDTYLIHAPDSRTPWSTSVRALARLQEDGLVRRIGVSNVNRLQLDEALELAPIAAVEVALSLQDDSALRGGVVERCDELGIMLLAHSPLGGPKRIGALARHGVSAELALCRRSSCRSRERPVRRRCGPPCALPLSRSTRGRAPRSKARSRSSGLRVSVRAAASLSS
jgi:aryl-alcohol dehydrogenase-like predicted oxidoreductase